jgi:hypothetical protein
LLEQNCGILFSDGVGRSGTYILIDMVLNRMTKGSKEIDIAATLEHIRDQRSGGWLFTQAQRLNYLFSLFHSELGPLKAKNPLLHLHLLGNKNPLLPS